jgi:peptidoglycan hydrolase-like protein with peptidoglycan-binding domain
MMGFQMRRTAAILAGIFALSGLMLFSAGTASAATPQCTTFAFRASPFPPPAGPPAGVALYYPIAANGTSYCWMQRGNYSWGVWALQRALNQCYGLGIAEDLDFGPATQRALRFAQAISGATVDGSYGPNTRSRLKYSSNLGGSFYCYQLLGFG